MYPAIPIKDIPLYIGPTLLLIIKDDAIINDEISNAPTNLFMIY